MIATDKSGNRHGLPMLGGARRALGSVAVPSTVQISKQAHIEGYGTEFSWTGAAGSPCVEFVGGAKSTVRGLSITGACAAGVRLSATGTGSMTGHCFRDVTVEGAAIGYHITLNGDVTKDVKNDHHRFDNCQAQDYTDAGMVIEGWNAKAICLSGCLFQSRGHGQYGIDTGRVAWRGGSFHWTGGMLSENSVADIRLGTWNDPITITGLYSQGSARFLQAMAKQPGLPPLTEGSPRDKKRFAITLSGVRWTTEPGNLPADKEIVQVYAPGPLVMTGCDFAAGSGGGDLRFRFQPKDELGADLPGQWLMHGCVIASANTDWFPARQPDSVLGSFWQDPDGAMTPLSELLV